MCIDIFLHLGGVCLPVLHQVHLVVQGLLNLLEVCTYQVRMTVQVDRLKTSLAGVPTPEACMMTGNGDIRY